MSLFLAIYELVLALRAQKHRKDDEDRVRDSRSGLIEQSDMRYLIKVGEEHDREYSSHMKNYQELIKRLKLSREQRLEREVKTKKTFLDYVYELSDEDAQKSVAEEIRRLNKLDNKELKRLVELGHLKGHFGIMEND